MYHRRCQNCGGRFEARRPEAVYCSGECKAGASRKRKAEAQAERDRQLRALFQEGLEILGEGEDFT